MPGTDLPALADELHRHGVRRIHTVAWRDLDHPDAGGSEVHADEVLQRWAAHGLDILHQTSTPTTPHRLWRHGYRVLQRGRRYSVFPRVATSELLGLAGPRDAVVEIWNGVPWLSPIWRRGAVQVTWLHHVHGPMWDQLLPGPAASFGRFLEAKAAPPLYRDRPVVTLAESSRDELVHLGFRPEQVRVVPPGIDGRFTADPDRRSTRPLAIAVGRLAPVKRFELVLEAAAAARRQVPDLELAIVGDGPLRPDLQAWIDDRGAGSWARLTGRVDDVELVDWYRRAWAVISASLAEGWGMTLTEAGACATPGVATDIVGHRGAIVPGVTGDLVEDPGKLGDALADLLTDHRRRTCYAAAAQERASTFTWDRTARDTLAVLVEEARRRRG